MKQFLILISISLFSLNLSAQCLPNGITFSTQTQIDNFTTDYPGCTQIMGDLRIEEATLGEITSLSGLTAVTSIGGNLQIIQNDALTSLSGLDNITSINGAVEITSNNGLTDVTGIANINDTDITDLIITNNHNLDNCNINAICGYLGVYTNSYTISNNGFGCHDIIAIRTDCFIDLCPPNGITFSTQSQIDSFAIVYPGCTEVWNQVLIEESTSGEITNLNGLLTLTHVEGVLRIRNNDSLTSLTGLDNVFIAVDLEVEYNSSLTDFTGLNGLISVWYLTIRGNPSLTSFSGLENISQVSEFSFTLEGNGALTNLSGLDNITIIDYFDVINNNALLNFTGLTNISNIRNLTVSGNDALVDFTGFDSLTTLGRLGIYGNQSMKSLTGLNNIVTTGGQGIDIWDNPSLTSLEALKNLTSLHTIVGGGGWEPTLTIRNNDSLKSLSGLENIDHTSIFDLNILNNDMLTTCEVLSICNYLGIPANTATIENNLTGCDTRIEVETACNPNSISQNDFATSLISYPNPTQGETVIEFGEIHPEIKLTARNMIGQTIFANTFKQTDQITFNLTGPSGLYLVEVKTPTGKTAIIKVIKE